MEPKQQTNSGLIIFVGLVAVIALILAWVAYNRSGQDVIPTTTQSVEEAGNEIESTAEVGSQVIEREAEELATDAELAAARIEARAELLAIEAELEVEENYAEAAAAVADVRADLAQQYANASQEVQMEWLELEQDMRELEAELRAGTASALDGLADIILRLEADARTDGV